MRKGIPYLLFIVFIFPLILFLSCDDDDETIVFNVSVSQLSLESNETQKTFTIRSNIGWVISSDETWCSVSPEYGTGNQEIIVTLTGENEDIDNPRAVTLTIKSGRADSKTIIIEQAAKPSEPKPEPSGPVGEEATIVFNATEHMMKAMGYWYYFSFETGEVVDTAPIDEEHDAIWKERTDWDIAFSLLYTKTNSGVSGIGKAGVIKTDDSEEVAKAFENLTTVPEDGYIVDETDRLMVEAQMGPPIYYTGGTNTIMNASIVPKVGSGELTPTVFAIRTAGGYYGKLYLKELTTGHIIFEYAYQPNGTTHLETVKE